MKAQRLFQLKCIVLIATIVFSVSSLAAGQQACGGSAQKVPATATQAAKLPQYAARLAQHGPAQGIGRHSGACSIPSRDRLRDGLLRDLYDNGPVNGTIDARTINFGYIVANSFTVPPDSSVSSLAFYAWLLPWDVLQNVQVSITSDPFGGTSFFNATVNFAQSDCVGNQYGFNVCLETGSFAEVNLAPGSYWVNLQNAVVNSGDAAYWDENSGPSLAYQTSVGTIPSEAFTILGTTTTTTYPVTGCMPEESDNFKVIHDFTGAEDGGSPSGVASDRAGNLYGRADYGGNSVSIYKLAQAGTGWILNNLYNFNPERYLPEEHLLIGDNGVLYAGASGGLQNCDGTWCGQIVSLRPSPTICRSISCSWTDNILYQFTGVTDAFQGGRLVSEHEGNLYGVGSGGADMSGAVFELSPSIGGWTETVIYSFPYGLAHGAAPTELLVGIDGNLYGIARAGGLNNAGVVFQLTLSANGWIQTVIYNVPNKSYFGVNPRFLVQDGEGNLFGIYDYSISTDYFPRTMSKVFMLKPSGGQWIYSELAHGDEYSNQDSYNNLVVDAAGNIWGTAEQWWGGCMGGWNNAYIFELAKTSDGWQYSTPVYWDYTAFPTSGALALDRHGNIYGTTQYCGSHGDGTVWQFTPTQ